MKIAFATILSIVLWILSLLLHLGCAAAIVIFFILYLNTADEGKKRSYLTAIITLAVLLVLMLLLRPLLIFLGWGTLLQ